MASGKLSFYTTAEEALRGATLTGKTAIVTGGNSGAPGPRDGWAAVAVAAVAAAGAARRCAALRGAAGTGTHWHLTPNLHCRPGR